MERYSILTEDRRVQCVQGCPVLVQALAITKDNQTGKVLIQCKMENMLPQVIVAAYVNFACFGIDGSVLPAVQGQAYLDLTAGQNKTFGDKTPVYAPDETTRRVEVTLQKVLYADGTAWVNEAATPFAPYGEDMRAPISSLGELAEQYKRDLQALQPKKPHDKLPYVNGSFAHCGCGKIYWGTQEACPDCSVRFPVLSYLTNEETLREHLQLYEEEQSRIAEEQSRIAEEQRQKKEREAAELKRIQEKEKIIMIVLAAIAALVLAVFAFYKFFLVPNGKYQAAITDMNRLSSDKIERAKTTFQELGGFRNSEEMVTECDYNLAALLMKSEDIDKVQHAQEILEELGEYKDAAAMLPQCDYNRARLLMNQDNVECVRQAQEIFTELGDYEDAPEMLKECDYKKAVLLTKGGTTAREKAKALLMELGDYKDAVEILRNFAWIGTWKITKNLYFSDNIMTHKDTGFENDIYVGDIVEIWYDSIQGGFITYIENLQIADGQLSIEVTPEIKYTGVYNSENDTWEIIDWFDNNGDIIRWEYTLERSAA